MRRWLAFGFLAAHLGVLLPAQQTGELVLTTEPEAEVFWQGTSIGLSDENGLIRISGIPPGSYSILVVKTGFLARSAEIRVLPGRQSRQLNLNPLAGDPLPDLVAPDPAAATTSTGVVPGTAAGSAATRPLPADPDPESTPPGGEVPLPAGPTGEESQPAAAGTEAGPGDETPLRTALERALEERRAAARDPGRSPTSDFKRPAVIPAPLETESDLGILVFWALALIAFTGFLSLFRKKRRIEQLDEEKSISDFERALSAIREEKK